jgi:crotonobetaine/carnitine-CoA ligase
MPASFNGFLALLTQQAAETPDRVFARFNGHTITLGDLASQSTVLAHWLDEKGVQPGDHVALMLHNNPLSLALLFAIAKARAVWVPVNVASVGDSLSYILTHAAPKLVIAEDDLIATIAACSATIDQPRLVSASDAMSGRDRGKGQQQKPFAQPGADAPYAIMYTSGTTGPPKGVIVSHRMLRLSGEAVALISDAHAGDIMFMWEPLYHIGGAQMIVLPLIRGVELAMVERFSASRFWTEVKASGATHIHFLGGILQILLKQPPSPLDQAHGVRIAWGGGCPREIWREFEQRFGIPIRECYGMTECSSVTTANLDGTLGAVGTAIPWFDVTIRRPDGSRVDAHEQGEIVVMERVAGALTCGYLNNPEATAKALRDGAFYTGDLGSWDAAGNMYFHGRMTDSARVKGQNVSAFEVESVVAKHPAVEACAMIAVAAEIGEQDIKVFVKPKAGHSIDPTALSAWLETQLAAYQRPRYIAIIADFERTPSQRIMKHRLPKDTGDAWDRQATQKPPET